MNKHQTLLILTLISLQLVSCTSQKAKVFGTAMPSMKAIHDKKFNISDASLPPVMRSLANSQTGSADIFEWLPNPTLHLYVFEHLSETGLPVPAYITFFKFYTTDHIASPSEQLQW